MDWHKRLCGLLIAELIAMVVFSIGYFISDYHSIKDYFFQWLIGDMVLFAITLVVWGFTGGNSPKSS